jgi:glutathione synthase/RimK-type ligase-like ATP-grasp enzyme
MTVFLIAGRSTPTNLSLLAAWRRLGVKATMVGPQEAQLRGGEGDVALARLDVLPTLDGVEAGLWELPELGRLGVQLLNHSGALLTVHDKLATALRLAQVGLPHPRTGHIDADGDAPAIGFPVVVKPRFGSWGRDVVLCRSAGQFERCLRRLRERRWFRRHGALVQEFVPPRGYDLRLLEDTTPVERVLGAEIDCAV